MQPPHSCDLLSPRDGNYNLEEEVFENGMEEEEPLVHAYRNHRHDDPTVNMSSDSGIGWGLGAWTGRGNLPTAPPSLPIPVRQQRPDMDLNAEAPDLSSSYVPPPTAVRIPQQMPPTVSDLHTQKITPMPKLEYCVSIFPEANSFSQCSTRLAARRCRQQCSSAGTLSTRWRAEQSCALVFLKCIWSKERSAQGYYSPQYRNAEEDQQCSQSHGGRHHGGLREACCCTHKHQ